MYMKSTAIIRTVLRAFKGQNIDYAIMRNYDFLLYSTKQVGKDVDIVVKEHSEHKIHRIMKKLGFIKEPICRLSKHTGYALLVPEEQKLLKFHFHLGGITGAFITYLKAESLLRRRKQIKDFFAISDEDQLVSLLMHASFDSPKYYKIIRSLIAKKLDVHYMQYALRKLLFHKTADAVLTAAMKPDFKKLAKLRNKIRYGVLFRRPWNILTFLKVRGGCGIMQLPRKIRPAPLVSLIGMDGAGKTTATKAMMNILDKNKIKAALVYTGRGKKNILPIQAVGRPYKQVEKKMKLPKTILQTIYTLAAPFFAADLFLRYWFSIFPKRMSKKIVITDRYATDMLVMRHVPDAVRKVLYAILPKPTTTIYLYNDPKILNKRKPQHPIEDLYRQEKLYNNLINDLCVIQIKSESREQVIADVGSVTFQQLLGG